MCIRFKYFHNARVIKQINVVVLLNIILILAEHVLEVLGRQWVLMIEEILHDRLDILVPLFLLVPKEVSRGELLLSWVVRVIAFWWIL
jgi:hypothetical protein